MDCLRLVQLPETTPEWAAKYRAQAATMMRAANSAMRLLLHMQAARRKLEADDVACDRRERTEHVATCLMAEALAAIPAPASKPEPKPSEAPPSEAPAEAGGPPGLSGAALTRWLGERAPDYVAAAERYAAAYPERAALIRRTGKPPCDTRYFDPPEDCLLPALVAGRTPALLALDHVCSEACPGPRSGAQPA